MDYLRIFYLIHWPVAGMQLEEGFHALNQLVAEGGGVRHLGVSNFPSAPHAPGASPVRHADSHQSSAV